MNNDGIDSNVNYGELTGTEYLNNLLRDLNSTDPQTVYSALVSLRVILEKDLSVTDKYENIDDLIQMVLRYCEYQENLNIQIEAVHVISNLSAGETSLSHKLIKLNFITLALKSFDSFPFEITDEILLILGNIISESTLARDEIIAAGFPEVLVNYIQQYTSKNGIWAFCNLFRGHPAPAIEFCDKYFPFLMKRIASMQNQQELEISEDCLWVLVELTEEDAMTNYLMQNDSHLLVLLDVIGSGNRDLITPALKVLVSILIHTNDVCNSLMNQGLAGKLLELLSGKNIQIKKEVCIVLSTLIAQNNPLLEIYINSGIISKMLYIIRVDSKDITNDACWVICQSCKIATSEQIQQMYRLEVLDSICELLRERDSMLLLTVLDIIYEFLYHGQKFPNDEGENFFITVLDNVGAIDKIEDLQDSPSELVQRKVENILTKFFELE